MHEIAIEHGRGLVILGPVEERKEDIALPRRVMEKIQRALEKRELEQSSEPNP